MTAAYQVLVSDSFIAAFAAELAATGKLALPAGLRLAGPLPPARRHDLRDVISTGTELDSAQWVTFADDGAPPELDGCRVELVLRLARGGTGWVIAERRVLP